MLDDFVVAGAVGVFRMVKRGYFNLIRNDGIGQEKRIYSSFLSLFLPPSLHISLSLTHFLSEYLLRWLQLQMQVPWQCIAIPFNSIDGHDHKHNCYRSCHSRSARMLVAHNGLAQRVLYMQKREKNGIINGKKRQTKTINKWFLINVVCVRRQQEVQRTLGTKLLNSLRMYNLQRKSVFHTELDH